MSTGFATTGYYLLDNPPARSQGRRQRRSKPTGCIVLHTAENATDTEGADLGAENVARFIQRRTTPGNYHMIGDRDSIIRMLPFSWEVWQDGTGSNAWAIGLSLAMRADDWPRLTADKFADYVDSMVTMAVEAAKWLKSEHGITVPATRISKRQSDLGQPGFIAHGDRDPARRSDPGKDFPWDLFLELYAEEMDTGVTNGMTPEQTTHVKAMQTAFNSTGLIKPPLVIDGLPGPKTTAASKTVSVAAMGTPDEDIMRLARLGQQFADTVANADALNNPT